MASRTNLFIVIVVLLLLVLYLGSIVVESMTREEVEAPEAGAPTESVNTDVTFEEDAKKYDEVVIVTEDDVREEEETEAENEEEEQVQDDEVATSTPLPTVMIIAGSITREGVLGSYCWEDICATSMIADLPYAAMPVSASSTISFEIVAEAAPERVLIFLKEVGGTAVTMSRELTVDEILAGAFALDQLPGEHLLFITGVWEGGQDVVHAFKINII